MLTFGDCEVSLIHLRGHTPGSLAVLYDAGGRLAGAPHVFTGDSLFPGGVGKTTYGSGYTSGQLLANGPDDFTLLLNDVTERLFDRLPDATWVYPGTATTPRWDRASAPGRVARTRLVSRTPTVVPCRLPYRALSCSLISAIKLSGESALIVATGVPLGRAHQTV